MPERIPMRYTVALQGFSEFERTSLASFFRLAQERAPAYVQAAHPAESDFIIADADHPTDVVAVRDAARLQDTIFIGARAPAGAVAWLARPIEPTHIVRELDLLLELRLASLDEPADTDWVSSGPSELMDTAGRPTKDVLVVDDSRIALKFLQMRLQGLGYRVHTARDAAQAMERLAAQAFSLVFLDVGLGPEGSMDGLAVCQHIKQRAEHPGGIAPRVLMVTGRSSSMDRVRGDLAGCDAYLTKPLMEDEFLLALRQLDPQPV
ncbi:MAG TPA: response regulator [Burkholderiaceae bacterium]|nr:response regulator [Burkholderiaceae bacterium]